MRGYKHKVAWILAAISLLFKTFCLEKREGRLLRQGHLIGTTRYLNLKHMMLGYWNVKHL